MKKAILISIVLVFGISVFAQVQVRPLPKKGFEKRIREYVDKMKVVDTHEHLLSLGRLAELGQHEFKVKATDMSFMWLLTSYSMFDMESAGASGQDFRKVVTDSLNSVEKWRIIKPYWEGSSNTTFNRSALLAADKLFGVATIDSTTVEELSEKIRKAYQNEKAWFKYVLKEKSNIEYAILNPWVEDTSSIFDPKIFKYSPFVNDFITIGSRSNIENFAHWKSGGIKTLADLVSSEAMAFQSLVKREGTVSVKVSLAYSRTLFFADVSQEEAEGVFQKIMNSPEGAGLSFDEVKPLQDYLMHRVLDLAQANHLPVQIHTGLQNTTGNVIENSKPTNLVNLFQEYPEVKFILFHGSYPYGGELATLAKNFRNVYIDMCWVQIISPSYSERYLNEWLETVPASKIMAFGGDQANIELVYSHLLIAKQIISNVLTAKVRDGYFTEAEAIKTAQMILHDNAVRILNLGEKK